MKKDPYTLTIAVNKLGNADGELYIDDGETYIYIIIDQIIFIKMNFHIE